MIIKERKDLAVLLKTQMLRADKTITWLAEQFGAPFPSMSRSINRADISVGKLQQIADALGCDLDITLVPRNK